MSSQDDLGMLWYGVPGVSFTPTDPSEVMLNTGITAPLLSDHPRSLIGQQFSQPNYGLHNAHSTFNFSDISLAQNSQMLFDAHAGDFVHSDYVYDQYDTCEEDSSSSTCMTDQSQQQLITNQQVNSGDDEANAQQKTKKPKVHHNPALKLKTPIAYQKDTDIAAIPIMREGMAVCEKCGAIGVKHAFYGKERKYCSLACARPPMQNSNFIPKGSLDISKIINKVTSDFKKEARISDCVVDSENETNERRNNSFQLSSNDVKSDVTSGDNIDISNFSITSSFDSVNKDYVESKNIHESDCGFTDEEPFPGLIDESEQQDPLLLEDHEIEDVVNIQKKKQPIKNSYLWESSYLDSDQFVAASVRSFRHSPMSDCWDQISTGMKVEVACGKESQMKDSFWVATVIRICGYKAKLRFEGFVDNSSKDFWVDLCSEEVHPVGWCATQGNALIPPKSIQNKYRDWKEFLMKRLTGARTLPTNFHLRIAESLKSRFSVGMNLEVVDKNRIAQMRVATVEKIIGQRLHLKYHGAPPDDNGFWCHEDAAIIHPVGWSREIGHEIVANQSYHESCADALCLPQDTTCLMFSQCPPTPICNQIFTEGMKLEAIDPLNLATICVATVMKVLEKGFLMIRIDSYDYDTTWSDWFCYHASSPNIFPAGFCKSNGINLTPPKGYEGNFSWNTYLADTNSIAAPSDLFIKESINHGFRCGMSLEAVDLMDPKLVCVATIKDVKGRLLCIHFDGWAKEFDQWVDCLSPDIFPVGWCDLVGYRLEAPHSVVPASNILRRKSLTRTRSGRRGRPFNNRRGSAATIVRENHHPAITSSTSYSITEISSSPVHVKRGRRPRLRGPRHAHSQVSRDYIGKQASDDMCLNYKAPNNEKEVCNVYYGRRGRPRRSSQFFRIMNSNRSTSRGNRSIFHSITGSLQSEDDVSDETSSGVTSLAGSENSSDIWDTDPVTTTTSISSLRENEVGSDDIPDLSPFSMSGKNSVPETDSTEDFLLNVENEQVENFLTNAGNNVTEEHISLSQSSDDYFVTSTLDVSFDDSSSDILTMTRQSPVIENHALSPSFRETSLNTPTPEASTRALEDSTTFLTLQEPHTSKMDLAQHSAITSSCSQQISPTMYIPRIIDNSVGNIKGAKIQPKLWSPDDVASFLRNNDCQAYCDNFLRKQVDGSHFIKLTQNDVMGLTGMKVGPSLKIHDLIQQLLAIVNPAQARYQATLLKRGISFGKS